MNRSIIKATLVAITLVFIFASVRAQSDFVVTLNSDTLKGFITTNAFGGHRFKKAIDDKSKKINVGDYKEYYIVGKRKNYCAVMLENSDSPIFMERIEKGKIEIFESVVKNINPSAGWLLVVWEWEG